MAAVLGLASAVAAAEPADFVTSFPAGVACDFELGIEGSGANYHSREFFDKNGNLVRLLTAGKGFALTFTNDVTGATFTEWNGSAL